MWWHCRCTGVRLMYTPVISIAVAFVLALVAPAHAGAPTDALKGHVDQVVKLLSDPSLRDRPEVRRAKVRKIAEDIFDYPDTARRALGPHWNARTQFNKIVQTEGYESLVLRLRAKETAEPAASPGRSRTDR